MKKKSSLQIAYFFVVAFFLLCVACPLFFSFLSATVGDFADVFSQKRLRDVMRNTALLCVCSTSLSVFIGYFFAYAVVKKNIPFKIFFSLVPIVHLVTPPFVGGLAFILLFGRQGFVTKTLLKLDVSLYGFWGLLIAQTLCFFPIAYLILLQTFKGINPDLEKTAKNMGAGNVKIFFTVTFPLSFSGIAASFLFIAVSVLSDFGNPLIVGGRFRVLALEIYTQLTGWLDIGKSVVLGILLVVPSVILFLLQNKFYKENAKRSATIGSGQVFKFFELGGFFRKNAFSKNSFASDAIFTVFVFFISLLILLQVFAIIAGSFQELWGVKTAFTFEHIKSIFKYTRELKNSVSFSLVAAVLSVFIAAVASFLAYRTKVPFRKTLDTLAQIPSAIPGSLLGLSILIWANNIRFNFSALLIVIAMTVSFLPFAYKIISNSYFQISKTLDNAALSLGADEMRVLQSVIAPLAANGIFGAFIYDFIRGVGTLSAVIFLVSFKTPLTSIKLVNLAEQGDWGDAAALALALTVLAFAILGAGILAKRIACHCRNKCGNDTQSARMQRAA